MNQLTEVLINPSDPKVLIVDEKKNGRFKPYNTDEIYERATSLKTHGQLQNIGVIETDKPGVYELNWGFGRTRGAQYLNEHDPDFKAEPFLLRATVYPKDTEEAQTLLRNVAENHDRKSLTPIDYANLIKRMSKYGMDDAAVLTAFGKDPKNTDHQAWLKRHKALSELPAAVQAKVHTRTMATDAALVLVGYTEKIAKQVLAEIESAKTEKGNGAGAKRGTGKATAKEVAQATEKVVKEAESKGEKVKEKEVKAPKSKGATAPKKTREAKNRSMPEVVKFLKDMSKGAKSDKGKKLAAALVEYITDPNSAEPDVVRLFNAL